MKIKQAVYRKGEWKTLIDSDNNPQLVLMFGSSKLIGDSVILENIKNQFPNAVILQSSTSGNIIGAELLGEGITLTAIEFEKSKVNAVEIEVSEDSFADGKYIMSKLNKIDLRHVFILSDGLNVNGTELIKGINANLPKGVNVTGGLAGDGVDFKKTKVGISKNLNSNNIVAIGLYGKELKIGYAAEGGWERFGIERKVTKSQGNVVYELDNQPALDLYKEYLGDEADALPGAAFNFPLLLKYSNLNQEVIRTVQSIDEENKSITFFGDVPEGEIVYLTTGNFSSLTKGANRAAVESKEMLGVEPELAIMVSCVGRKVVMTEWTEDELETVVNEIGKDIPTTGFYSYGELSPTNRSDQACFFHNQTMALTLLSEN